MIRSFLLILNLFIFSLNSIGQSDKSNCGELDAYDLLFFASNNEEEALILVAQLTDRIRENPNKPSWYFLRGINKSYLNDNRGAIDDYRTALRLLEAKPFKSKTFESDGLLEINTNLAMSKSLSSIEDYQRAIEFANKALLEAEKWGVTYVIMDKIFFRRGAAYLVSGNLELGCKDMSRAGENGCAQAYAIIETYCQ